jgi:hypothetical protein
MPSAAVAFAAFTSTSSLCAPIARARRRATPPIASASSAAVRRASSRERRPPATTAWIAPDGAFYPCRISEHDALGVVIAEVRNFGELRKRGDLTECGWLRISENGWLFDGTGGRVTQPQYDTVFDVFQASSGKQRATLSMFFELLVVS